MMRLLRLKNRRYAFFFGFLIAVSLGTYGYLQICAQNISPYMPKRDRAFILDIFKNDWYWLVSEYSTDFSPEYMLDNRASSKNIEHKNNLSIHVYLEDKKPVGFIAFYKKNFYKGRILFLDIVPEYRRKNYAQKLLIFACNTLKNEGIRIVDLTTRVSNTKAQNVYKKVGFYELSRDEGFVDFQKIL